ncbi:MAG: hypothetical protein COA57_12135 [Flavobacteriales bacterium]|nr:MAG: hypothetical protein COA57_12135 [Flavobacteriales bacterium]
MRAKEESYLQDLFILVRELEALGIVNSKLMFWYYRNENNEFDTLFPKIKAKEIRALPIVEEPDTALAELVKRRIEETLELHKR